MKSIFLFSLFSVIQSIIVTTVYALIVFRTWSLNYADEKPWYMHKYLVRFLSFVALFIVTAAFMCDQNSYLR